MALGVGAIPVADSDRQQKVAAVRDAFVARLATVSANPMRMGALPNESPYEVDSEDESDE
jgi:hypothetical protein